MMFGGSMVAISQFFTPSQGAMFIIVLTVSRTISIYDIITKKPMSSSQYNGSVYEDPKEKGIPAIVAATVVSLIMYFVFIFDFTKALSAVNALTFFYTIVMVTLMKAVAGYAGSRARKQLDGMNGDISGCMTVLGEMTGVMFIALMTSFGF